MRDGAAASIVGIVTGCRTRTPVEGCREVPYSGGSWKAARVRERRWRPRSWFPGRHLSRRARGARQSAGREGAPGARRGTRAHERRPAQRKEREFTMTTTVTRRDLFKFGGLAALGVAGASTLAGCGQPKTVAEAAAEKGPGRHGRRYRPRVPRAAGAHHRFRRDPRVRRRRGRRRRVGPVCRAHRA
mgnify:CR=1 FL=1